MSLIGHLRHVGSWLAPDAKDWRLVLRGPASAERARLRNAWTARWTDFESTMRSELNWTDTGLLDRQHAAFADTVAAYQLRIRKIVALDVWILAALVVVGLLAAIPIGLLDPLAAVGYLSAAGLLVTTGYRARRSGPLVELVAIIAVAASAIRGALTVVDARGMAPWVTALAAGAGLGAYFWGIVLVSTRILLPKISAREMQAEARRRPIEMLLIELFVAIDWLSGAVDDFLDQERRRKTAVAFDQCSKTINSSLLRYLDPPPTMRRLVQVRLDRAARALHGYGLWVLLPNQASRDELRRRCLTMVAALELREFELLPDDPPPDAVPGGKLVVFLEVARRTLLMAIVPLGVLLAYRMGYLNDHTALKTWIGYAVLWVALNLGYLLDPQVNTKLTAFKDASTVLHPAPAPAPAKK